MISDVSRSNVEYKKKYNTFYFMKQNCLDAQYDDINYY